MVSGLFLAVAGSPPPPDFNLAIDQTNKRRPSILTRQISHLHRSTAGFRIANLGGFHRQSQGWISMGPASTDFTQGQTKTEGLYGTSR